jgi:formate-dependent nitrite reductase membrane component NrfD
MTTNSPSEKRLEELREQAWKEGVVPGKGVDVAGGPIPRKPGYYGQAVVKPPVWTWEIPLYFFVGGLSGMSTVIALAAAIFHHVELARAAMWLAAIGVVLSPLLLILDLGRPYLFINMLRVFKPQSAMSMGAWILSAFGVCVVAGLIALELHAQQIFGGTIGQLIRIAAGMLIFGSAFLGTLLATYTGVLIGATVIPAWFLHRVLLPIHFGTAGLGSAAGLLELLGHRIAALNALGYCAAAIESALLIWLSVNKHGMADRAVHEHASGWIIRIGEILTGPLALVLRLLGQVPFAAISFLIGALVSRFGWIAVGKASGSDPESVFAAERY